MAKDDQDDLVEKLEQHVIADVKAKAGKLGWKWITIIGLTGIIAAGTWVNDKALAWKAVSALPEAMAQSQEDRKSLHDYDKSHANQQDIELNGIKANAMALERQLNQYEKNQAERLDRMEKKLDFLVFGY
jgi:hypothetical protein